MPQSLDAINYGFQHSGVYRNPVGGNADFGLGMTCAS